MDVESSGAGNKQCCSPPSSSQAELSENMKGWRRLRRFTPRRALPAVCVAATVITVVVLSAAGGSPYEMPDSWFSDGSAQGPEDAPLSNLTADQLLDGLLTAEFGERSCRSRYEFAAYHKKSSHKPSRYLLAKLRKQELLQKRCGPGTAAYRTALRQLRSGEGAAATDCRYLVSINYRGLGNRMLAIASAFLYAVLTERVLLVDRYKQDVGALFCEPFPGTTWLLPAGRHFPLGRLMDYDGSSKESLGNMLKSNTLAVGADGNTSWSSADCGRRPPYVYLHLAGGYDFHDKLFFCDAHQRLLRGAPWLVMKTDAYLVPGLFLVPSFQDELGEMFPEKDAAFYHLGRYLFHPTNAVWHAITSYYRSHLAGAGQRVGIQIRVFRKKQPPLQHVLDQVLSCARREKLLPETTAASSKSTSDQAVLVTSLSSWYYEKIRDEYGGGRVSGGVHQPSHEGRQRWGDTAHDMRALSEMYLLSTCDVLVTTGFSTFGYVAQGLGGLRPWVMPTPPMWEDTAGRPEVVPEPPCVRAASIEPCFHSPSYYDCAVRRNVDVGKVVPYVRRCEDVSWGIKLVEGSSKC